MNCDAFSVYKLTESLHIKYCRNNWIQSIKPNRYPKTGSEGLFSRVGPGLLQEMAYFRSGQIHKMSLEPTTS